MTRSVLPKGRAKGGIARANSLSDQRKTEIAKKAAQARWQNPRTEKHSGIKVLVPSGPVNPRNPMQAELDLQIQKQDAWKQFHDRADAWACWSCREYRRACLSAQGT